MAQRSGVLRVGIGFLTFVTIGLDAGLMGVAWPSIRDTFGVGDDAFGVVALISTAGSLAVTFGSGSLVHRLGIGPLLMVSCAVGALGSLGYALAPTWWSMVLFRLIAGIGTAAINPGINTYFATHESAGRMNWLHACFGLGGTLGPVAMAAVLSAGQPWRWGYGIVVLGYALLAAAFAGTLRAWPTRARTAAGARDPSATGDRHALLLPAVWLSLLMFFTFTGMEASAGQWPYTLFTEARGVSAAVAGGWVSAYWASMTVGRVFFGLVVDRVGARRLVRLCMAGALVGAAGIWLGVRPGLGFAGLVLTGFCLAPLFPVLTSNTGQRLGPARAAHVIGYQITAVKLGLAAIPALGGLLAARSGTESIGPFLVAVATATILLHEATLRVRVQPEERAGRS